MPEDFEDDKMEAEDTPQINIGKDLQNVDDNERMRDDLLNEISQVLFLIFVWIDLLMKSLLEWWRHRNKRPALSSYWNCIGRKTILDVKSGSPYTVSSVTCNVLFSSDSMELDLTTSC